MNHARVKALKGNGKTVSKKAQKSGRASGTLTPQGSSPIASLLTSPSHSNTASRVASDASDNEEDGDFDFDDMISSVHSGGSGPDVGDDAATSFDLQALIDGLSDRKRNNSNVREQYLSAYLRMLRNRYNDWPNPVATTLTDIFLKDANRGVTPRERLLSLQAYTLTLAVVDDLDVYEAGSKLLKQILTDEDDQDCRVHSIYALCMTTMYGGGLEEAALELMQFFVDIVQSDGESIEAHDDAVVVSAAMRGWSFVASHVDDYADYADSAMDAFVDQLDSGDVEVQSLAGHCIALIYESSRNHETETGEPFQLPYDPQRLARRLGELVKLSAKSVSRKDRRDLRENLVSVVTSLERGVGPYYSTALYIPEPDTFVPPSLRTDDGRAEYGCRCKLRLGSRTALIDTWSLYSRVEMMKLLFRGGLENHIFVNPVVMECLEDAEWDEALAVAEPERKPKLSAKARKR
ncbi:hypothetical protein CP533_4154 [Ophiocordyceps camponoti-saundersi (nom. inval.)]|nr:hypothetical protein CP533_4154 [Ophiocordyceps camponoti-saundersi (nom. inval.)]